MTRRGWWGCLVLAALAVLVLYAHTVHFSFYWDDFDDLRPRTWRDLASAFHGHYQPWAREGIYFYRPLTSVYLATATWLFGLDATRLHLIPLVVLTAAATLAGLVARRITRDDRAGAITALLFAVHPLTATAIGPWIANQYQGFLVIAVAAALLLWQRQAERERGLTPALAIVIVAAAWLKEDGLALGPALLAVHLARAHITRDVPPPSRRMIGGVLGLAVALVLWRAVWLPSQVGYGVPDAAAIVANLSRAWRYALVWHVSGASIGWSLSLLKAAVLLLAIVAVIRARTTAAARLIVTGLALLCVMNLPLGLVSSESRWHVISLCVVLITAGAVLSVPVTATTRWLGAALIAAAFAWGARERIDQFATCAAETRLHDPWAAALPELPPELHAWIVARDAACAAGATPVFTRPMTSMTWGAR